MLKTCHFDLARLHRLTDPSASELWKKAAKRCLVEALDIVSIFRLRSLDKTQYDLLAANAKFFSGHSHWMVKTVVAAAVQ